MSILFNQTATNAHPDGKHGGTLFQVGPFKQTALILASAHGTAHYSGPTANAGILLEVQAAANIVRADSFEAQSSNLGFNAAATTFIVLQPGDKTIVQANVNPLGAGAEARNTGTVVTLHVVAIDASAGLAVSLPAAKPATTAVIG